MLNPYPIKKETASLITKDGISLAADIYRPDSRESFPILLMRQPYGKTIASTVVYAHPSWYSSIVEHRERVIALLENTPSLKSHVAIAIDKTYPHIPIVMHQDHGNEPATCYSAIRNGFDRLAKAPP